MQKNMEKLLDIALEKSCFFEYTEADGLGMTHCLIEMYRIRKELLSMDEEKAYELCASYFKQKKGKKAILKGIDFVQSFCAIKDKDILGKLEDIPLLRIK